MKIPEVETNQRPLKAGDLVEIRGLGTVSYTHLDVYKRQVHVWYSKREN